MKSVVVIPTYSRPEMLWNCLECIAACPEFLSLQLHVCIDQHTPRGLAPRVLAETNQVLERFSNTPGWTQVLREPTPWHGNSRNVLLGLAEAHEKHPDFVFLVEDDIMVEPDFFSWNYSVQAAEHPFASIAVANTRSGEISTKKDYCSWGVCFPPASLPPILRHARPAYFSNLEGYCKNNFGPSTEYPEQDGLILRVIQGEDGRARFAPPEAPKARHIGWYGYNRSNGGRPHGTLEDRYSTVKARLQIAVL